MNKIIEVRFGSSLYGTNTPTSDLDIKGVFLPTAREILLGRVPRNISSSRTKQEGERNKSTDVDTEFWSLGEFLKLLAEGQTGALDLLFANEASILSKGEDFYLFSTIKCAKQKLLSKNILSFIGYARTQAAKYGIKGSRIKAVKDAIAYLKELSAGPYTRLSEYDLNYFVLKADPQFVKWTEIEGPGGLMIPHLEICGRKFQLTGTIKYTLGVLEKIEAEYGARARMAEKNEGIDWKALSHAVRVNGEGIELLTTGSITFPRPDAQLLKDIKAGKLPYNEVAALIEQGLVDLEAAQKVSTLPEKPDQEWIDTFLAAVYGRIVYEEMEENY